MGGTILKKIFQWKGSDFSWQFKSNIRWDKYLPEKRTTRSISIVSKPIKAAVVVVVIVDVFVKKNRSKNFLIQKQSMSKKTFGLKVLDPKEFGS